jgi:hypothetical protein
MKTVEKIRKLAKMAEINAGNSERVKMVQETSKVVLPVIGMVQKLLGCVNTQGIRDLGDYMHNRAYNGDKIDENTIQDVFTLYSRVSLAQDGINLGYEIAGAIASSSQRATWAHESVCQGLSRVLNRAADILEHYMAEDGPSASNSLEMACVRENARTRIILNHKRRLEEGEYRLAKEYADPEELDKKLKECREFLEQELQKKLKRFDRQFPA